MNSAARLGTIVLDCLFSTTDFYLLHQMCIWIKSLQLISIEDASFFIPSNMSSIQQGPSIMAKFSFWAHIVIRVCYVVTNNQYLFDLLFPLKLLVLTRSNLCLPGITADNWILKLSFYLPLISQYLLQFITEQFSVKDSFG